MHEPLSLQPDDAAQVMGISRTRVFNAIRDGKLKAKKDGKVTLITFDECKRYVESLPDREPQEVA